MVLVAVATAYPNERLTQHGSWIILVSMNFTDTHCHIHESALFAPEDAPGALERAIKKGVTRLLLIGTNAKSSVEAIEMARMHAQCFAVVGVHPHDSKDGVARIGSLLESHQDIVGIGEIGLDYFYDNSPRDIQVAALEQQLQWAKQYDLPVSFHVREAFDDFWPILANFSSVRGVLHSYTDSIDNLQKALARGLYVGVNGISTFTKTNHAMWDMIPLENMLLETDAPFLTPAPHRGKVNEPAFVRHVAEYHADRRGVELEHLARVTSANASNLFSI